jgi:hypothetical protein
LAAGQPKNNTVANGGTKDNYGCPGCRAAREIRRLRHRSKTIETPRDKTAAGISK